jgi:hypothetical protein
MPVLDQLREAIANAQVGRSRLTDLVKGKYTLSVVADEKDAKKLHVSLISEKKVKTPLTINSLAGMRIATSQAKVANILSTEDARATEEIGTFQNSLALDNSILTEGMQFEVIHKLRIKDNINDKGTDKTKWVYNNNCYKGYPEYVKAATKANGMPSATDDDAAARNAAFNEATATLRASGLKDEVTLEDKNLQMLPVFTVTK